MISPCRAAIKSRCKDLEPWLLRQHTLALRRRLIQAAENHQQQVADRHMRELIAAEDKQLATTASQKKSKGKKKKVLPAVQLSKGAVQPCQMKYRSQATLP